jgi:hypothetical protein
MCGIGAAKPSYKTATVQNSNGNVRTQKRVTTRMELNSSAVTAPMAVLAWMIARLPGKALVVLLIGAIMHWSAPVSVRAYCSQSGISCSPTCASVLRMSTSNRDLVLPQ